MINIYWFIIISYILRYVFNSKYVDVIGYHLTFYSAQNRITIFRPRVIDSSDLTEKVLRIKLIIKSEFFRQKFKKLRIQIG